MEDEKLAIAEAALFLSEDPLSIEELADAMNIGAKGFVAQVVEELQEDLESEARGMKIIENDGEYEMVVKNEHVDQVEHLAPHRDLDDGMLRTLALIAYNTPVKQSEVVDIRGNRAYSQIKELTNRGFVESEKDGRTKVLEVTDHFLEYFELGAPDEFAMQEDDSEFM